MALYKVTQKQSGGGTTTYPTLIAAMSTPINTSNTLTYTFTESGTFQYYVWWMKYNAYGTSSDVTIELNGTALTPTATDFTSSKSIAIAGGEIQASIGDIITYTNVYTNNAYGMQAYVIKDANLSNLSLINFITNNNTRFSYSSTDFPCIEAAGMHRNNANNWWCHILSSAIESPAFPSGLAYFYDAKCIAFKL